MKRGWEVETKKSILLDYVCINVTHLKTSPVSSKEKMKVCTEISKIIFLKKKTKQKSVPKFINIDLLV